MGGEARVIEESVDSHPLVAWLDEELAPGRFDRTLVVTTSQQSAVSLCRALARHRAGLDRAGLGGRGGPEGSAPTGLLGVHFLAAIGLARTVLMLARANHPQLSPDPLLEREILRDCLSEHPGEASRYALRHPGALTGLLGVIKELETAGWPEPGGELTAWGRQVREIGETYRGRVAGWATRGRLMELALEATARASLEDLPARVLLVGYPHPEGDLTLLLDRLEDRGVKVRRSPVGEERPEASRHSSPDVVEELRLAARLCLQSARDGIPWAGMVVAAPSLGPYASSLHRAFGAEGVPFVAKAESPLLREPRAAFYRHAADLFCERTSRASYTALVASPVLRPLPNPDELGVFERLSRERPLEGGAAVLEEFLDQLEGALDRTTSSRHLYRVLSELHRVARQRCPTAREQVRRLDDFARSVLTPAESPRDLQVAQRIDDCLAALEQALTGTLEASTFVSELHGLFSQRGLPIRSGEGVGVAVVEYPDALSFPAAHLHLLGLTAELVPRRRAGGLDQTDRQKFEGLASVEEDRSRQLEVLHRSLAHPTRFLVLSHPRSMGQGRRVTPSPWLDDTSRETRGGLREIRHQAHPLARARERVDLGICPPDLGIACLALGGAGVDDLVGLAGNRAASWWNSSRRLERFGSQSLAWDGDVGAERTRPLVRAGIRVGDLERIGRCPQQFLFSRLMKLDPLPLEQDPLEPRLDLLGSLIHGVLDDLQGEFREEMASTEPRRFLSRMAERARELLDEKWPSLSKTLAPRVAVLQELLREQWAKSLARAIEADLGLLEDEQRIPEAIEVDLREDLAFARPGCKPISLRVIGRPDRIDRTREGERVILDFKTGRHPARLADGKGILGGWQLQLVLYGMMLQAARGELPKGLEVRPIHGSALDEEGPRLDVSSDFLSGKHRVAVDETLAVLVELLHRGAFVPNVDHGPCAFCDFKLACRRLHPPSAERVRRSTIPEVQRYLALSGKSTRRPLLDIQESR